MMKHFKLCLSAVLLLMTGGAFAQDKTDITDTYLQNAALTTDPRGVGNGWDYFYSLKDRGAHYASGTDTAFEVYSAWSGDEYNAGNYTKEYSLLQNVYLPEGTYCLTVNAFYRYAEDLYSNISYADLIAGAKSVNIKNLRNGYDLGNAAGAFQKGEYLNTLYFTMEEDGFVEIGVRGRHPLPDVLRSWLVIGPFKLYTVNINALREAYTAAYITGMGTLSEAQYSNVTGSEHAALNAAVYTDVDTNSPDDLIEKTSALNTATANFIAAKDAYDKLVFENARAVTLGATPVDIDENMTAAKAKTAVEDLMVAEYNAVNAAYTVSVELGEWHSEGTTTMSNEHWSGTARSYMNQDDSDGKGWNAHDWGMLCSQEIDLPAGEYVFRVAARRSDGATVEIEVRDDYYTFWTTLDDFPVGNTGRGITTAGVASFDPSDTYANGNNGFGWQWRYIPFTLTEEESTVFFYVRAEAHDIHQWASFGDYTVMCKPNMETVTKAWNELKKTAKAIIDAEPIMEGIVWMYLNAYYSLEPTDLAGYLNAIEKLSDYIAKANVSIPAYAALGETIARCADLSFADNFTARENVSEVISGYNKQTISTADVNSIVTTLKAEYRQYLKDAIAGYSNANAYGNNLGITTTGNPVQGWSSTTGATGARGFITTSQGEIVGKDETGNLHENWRSTGDGGLNGNMYQVINNLPNGKYFVKMIAYTRVSAPSDYIYIKTATDEKHGALMTPMGAYIAVTDVVEVTDGTVEIGLHIGSGCDWAALGKVVLYYTELDDYVRTTPVGKLGTICLPYDATVEGATVYTPAVEGNKVTLTDDNDGKLLAGTAYIYEATAATQTFTPALLTSDLTATPTIGELMGVFKATKMAPYSYVMQTQNEVQKFYKVTEANNFTLQPYHAYLTVSSPGKYNEYDIEHGQSTGINAVETLSLDNATIYNLNGQKMSRLQKGVNIINGKKVVVK